MGDWTSSAMVYRLLSAQHAAVPFRPMPLLAQQQRTSPLRVGRVYRHRAIRLLNKLNPAALAIQSANSSTT
jgi:hypothetical protein